MPPDCLRPTVVQHGSSVALQRVGHSDPRCGAPRRSRSRLIGRAAIDDGSRILTKYYSNPHPPAGNPTDYPGQIAYKTPKDQKAFEKGLLGKSADGVRARY